MAAVHSVPLSPEGRAWLYEHGPDCQCEQCFERAKLVTSLAYSFRTFLNYWKFVDQDSQQVRTLGEGLWAAQEEFVRVTDHHDWVFYLKARQLGETTIACAYDVWVARFRWGGINARVHVFSKREKEAQSLLERCKFGYHHLPSWMHLKVTRDTMTEFVISAGSDDNRTMVAYPADNDTARGETCVHAHLDEWAFMGNPKKVWGAVEPSAAGSVHFITTGQGPENWTSTFWRKVLVGDVVDRWGQGVYPCFIDALQRPDRSAEWLARKKSGMDSETALWEYPMTWKEALSGAGDYVFKDVELDAAAVDAYGFQEFEAGRKYIIAWDIGRTQDAAVGVVLDVTEDVFDVVAYRRLLKHTYPQIQREIKILHEAYPGSLTVIEDNAAGMAVRENLDIPERQLLGFNTTKPSKARIIAQLRLRFQQQTLKYNPDECPELETELRGYQLPDDDVVQDSVMALAIAVEHADRAYAIGRVMSIAGV